MGIQNLQGNICPALLMAHYDSLIGRKVMEEDPTLQLYPLLNFSERKTEGAHLKLVEA